MAIIPSEFEKSVVIDTPQRQKTKKLIAAFIGIAIFTIGVIYFGFFSGSPSVPVETGTLPAVLPGMAGVPGQISAGAMGQIDQSNKLFESLNGVTLENPIFKDKKFQSLILSDRLPVVIGEKGRKDPFAPL